MNDLLGGRYRLGNPLGRGGMGTVYEAVQEGLGRRVAVKLLDERLSYDREQLERFRREAEVVAALGHPNIVQVTDFQYPDDLGKQPFLVMELLRGDSLGSCIEREGVLKPQRVAFIVAQVLSALATAHRAGIVHRDIKPDNIFLLADAAVPDTVKVLDFGIAKLTVEGQQKLTGTGAMLGTPAFMAPEQARGESDVDARADLYAVGATMYQALTGKLPFEAASVPALLFAIVEKTPVPLRELRPDLPADFVAVVERAMAKDRNARFSDADDMRDALAPWSGLPMSTRLATAATVASGKIEPYNPSTATPVVVSPTPAPAMTPTPARSGPSALTLIALVLVVGIVATASVFIVAFLTKNKERRADVDHATASTIASASAGPSASASVTISSTAAIASAAPIAIGTHVHVGNATTSASAAPATPASVAPPPKAGKRYGGTTGFLSFKDFSGCSGCDWQAFGNEMGMRVPAISACFAASEHEPPVHENPDYDLAVSESGAVTLVKAQDGAPNLDRCLVNIVKSVPFKKGAGSFRIGFRGECTKGWVGHCD